MNLNVDFVDITTYLLSKSVVALDNIRKLHLRANEFAKPELLNLRHSQILHFLKGIGVENQI